MKKARNIKIIKSGSTERNAAVSLPEESAKAENIKRCPVKVVNDWVREHYAQKQAAEQTALSLLYGSERPDKIKDKYSNR